MTTLFFQQVHQVVRLIPPGCVATYGQIACLLGQPRAARTVGWALRSTPEDGDVPWQRVLNARGAISFGVRSPGASLQRALLEEEGVVFDDQGRVDLKVYGWAGLDPAELRQLLDSDP
jgi:methylated-DNA-protein-cysteine methyltransferase-like protein